MCLGCGSQGLRHVVEGCQGRQGADRRWPHRQVTRTEGFNRRADDEPRSRGDLTGQGPRCLVRRALGHVERASKRRLSPGGVTHLAHATSELGSSTTPLSSSVSRDGGSKVQANEDRRRSPHTRLLLVRRGHRVSATSSSSTLPPGKACIPAANANGRPVAATTTSRPSGPSRKSTTVAAGRIGRSSVMGVMLTLNKRQEGCGEPVREASQDR